MEPMELNASAMVASAETAFRAATALAVQYSFSVVGAIVLLFVGFFLAGVLERSAYASLGRFRGFDDTLRQFFSKIIRYAVLVLVFVTVLAQFGVQTASIIAALGAMALAIGLALQGTLQNIAAGIMLLVLRPFRVGEFVEAGPVTGTIVDIGLFATELKTLEGLFVLSPNSELWNSPVTNFSRNPVRRNDVTIGIGYNDDIDLAQETLAGLAEADERILADPAAITFVSELGDSAVGVTIRYWTATSDFLRTKLDLTKAAKQAFDAKGISIPFPQRDIHYIPANGAIANGDGRAV